ncbi:MAG: hypothetical protein M3022_05575 [Actinomycetota bacterium]|nr:hypothetical protein [Actinomycetota bacterium]
MAPSDAGDAGTASVPACARRASLARSSASIRVVHASSSPASSLHPW